MIKQTVITTITVIQKYSKRILNIVYYNYVYNTGFLKMKSKHTTYSVKGSGVRTTANA